MIDIGDNVTFFSLSILTAIFPGELGLANFIEAKDDGSTVENWSYKSCKAPVKLSPPTNQHPTFYRPDALPVSVGAHPLFRSPKSGKNCAACSRDFTVHLT